MAWNVPSLLTADETAKALGGVSVHVVNRERRAGRLVGTLVGRGYRYHPDDIAAYVAAQRVEREPDAEAVAS